MTKAPNMKYFFEEAIKTRIESYETRSDQCEAFIEANDFAILALKAKFKNDESTYTVMWDNHIIKTTEAKALSDRAYELFEKYKTLMKIYDRGVNWINNKDFEDFSENENKEMTNAYTPL